MFRSIFLTIFLCLLVGGTAMAEKTYQVKEDMMVHLRTMEKTVKTAPSKTVVEHHKIASSLDENLKKLVASCTMTGEAHDALHDWLVPFMTEIQEYGTDENLKSCNERLARLQASFVEFNKRFY